MPRYRLAPITRLILLRFLVVCALSSHAVVLKADIIFTNIDLGNDNGCCGVTIYGGPFLANEAGALFVVPSGTNYLLNDMQAVVSSGLPFGTPSPFDVSIYSNAFNCAAYCGDTPTTLIATTGPVVSPSYPPGIVAVSPGAPTVLAGGAEYWLVLSPSNDFNSEVVWSGGGATPIPSGEDVQMRTSFGESPGWEAIDYGLQFQIDGTPISSPPSGALPEPDNLIFLVAIGLAVIVFVRLKRGPRPDLPQAIQCVPD